MNMYQSNNYYYDVYIKHTDTHVLIANYELSRLGWANNMTLENIVHALDSKVVQALEGTIVICVSRYVIKGL